MILITLWAKGQDPSFTRYTSAREAKESLRKRGYWKIVREVNGYLEDPFTGNKLEVRGCHPADLI